MVDIFVFDFKIKSSVHDYEVKFVEDSYATLKNEICDGDIIIIDNKVKNLYPELVNNINNNIIGLDAYGINIVEKKFGRLDALINNAGVAEFGPIESVNFEGWKRVLSTNLDGVFLCSQFAIPLLKVSKGVIVNIASISGLRASTLRVAYGTSKAAVIHLTKQQAVELGEFGIRSNCVAPGPVRTKLAMAVHTKEIIEAYHDAIPLNRYGSEEEIANAIAFLASDKARVITGQLLSADGGFESAGVGLPTLRSD